MDSVFRCCKPITHRRKLKNTILSETIITKPNKIVTSLIKGRSTKDPIIIVEKHTTGDKTYNINEMLDEAHSFYSKLYSKSKISLEEADNLYKNWNFKVDDATKANLDSQVTAEEIEYTIKRLKRNSNPGPDNIPNEIYKIFCKELSPHLAEMIQSIQNGGEIPKS